MAFKNATNIPLGKAENLIGRQFSKLTVTSRAPNQTISTMWNCDCSCGKTTIVRGTHLKANSIKSCGCHNIENLTKHGQYKTRLYTIWQDMKSRCSDKNQKTYKYYGGKGISVDLTWESDFNTFAEWANTNGYNDKLTIDRIDGNKNYTPKNCRWTTNHVQSANRVKASNNTSGYIGVTWNKARQLWQAQVKLHGKLNVLGHFVSKKEAAVKRDAFLIKNNLNHYTRNFPNV